MKILKNNKGQSLIEASLVAPVLVIICLAVAFISYRGVLYYYADFQLYEAMICTQHTSVSECRKYLNQKIHSVLIWGKIEKLSLQASSSEVRAGLQITFAEKTPWIQPSFRLHKSLLLPLK